MAVGLTNSGSCILTSKDATGEPSVPISFTGVCGLRWPGTHGSHQYVFDHVEHAPQALCNRAPGQPDPDPDATGRFLTSLIERHNEEILHAKPWICQICGAPAKELYHSTIPFLNPGTGASVAFHPSVWSTVVPICRSAGGCDRKAGALAYAFAKDAIPWLSKSKNGCCERCGNVKGVKRCSGCKSVGYCSIECQSLHWPFHKKQCRLAQKERVSKAKTTNLM